MIYTVTLNPAVDYYISMDKFVEGKLNLSKDGYTLAGGKGINVSKVLKNCGVDSVALGFVGGFTGDYIKSDLKDSNIAENFIELKENTRINIKIKTEINESEIAGKSPNITQESVNNFFNIISKIKGGDILILSGSVPNSLSADIYAQIIEKLPQGVAVILDARGEAFKLALEKGVYLVKPNKHELEEFFNEKYNSIDEIIEAGKKLRDLGSENVIISMGKEGSILITSHGEFIGNVPQGELVSSVGAGDSMVAGTLYGLVNGISIYEAYKYGIAAGSATAFKSGLANLEDIKKLLKGIEVRKK